VHIFGTHYPPIDPAGARAGSFRSRKEAAKLLSLLAAGEVDLTLYGHIHSYYSFSNAGIPAHISGGGGAIPERLDGIGRHFMVIETDPPRGVGTVGLVRVD
jgi:Icc protein